MPQIIKNDGEIEEFDPQKLKESLLRAKTSNLVTNEVVRQVVPDIKDGMTTSEIYTKAFEILNKKEKRSAAMYSIRRSILNFGPSGFPFEKFVAEIFKAKGYLAETGKTLKGKCIEHEMDVVVRNDNELFLFEVKFHNQLGAKSDTKTVLYMKARFNDLENQTFNIDGKKRKMTRGTLVTNTKFTHSAIKYAECVGEFDLISWDYPEKGNLYDLIHETSIQPITCIEILKDKEKERLIEKGIVNCKALKDNESIMKEVGISDAKIAEIKEHIDTICSI